MTQMLFYKTVVAVDRKKHKKLRINLPDSLEFARKATVIPIVAGEFVDVSRRLPIAFLKLEDDSFLPVAIVGLPDGENLFIDAEGQWTAGYLPAFIRRYPYVFAETAPDQLTLCMDEDYPGFSKKEGEPLFDAEGKPSTGLERVMALLQEFQNQYAFTRQFMQKVVEAGLLMEANANANLPDGRTYTLQGLWIIDEAKFKNIPVELLKSWFASGELGMVYSHLMSLGNLLQLFQRPFEAE